MFGLGLHELLIVFVIAILLIVPYWKIFSKAGFSGWLSLTMLIPLINLLVPYYLAFAAWPVHKKLVSLEDSVKQAHKGDKDE